MNSLIGSRARSRFMTDRNVLGIFILLLALSCGPSVHAEALVRQDTLYIGTVSTNFKKDQWRLGRFAEYLQNRLVDTGIERVEVLLAPDNKTLLDFVKTKKLHILFDRDFFSFRHFDEIPLEYLARGWRNGIREYRSIIFTRRDSNTRSIYDLIGKTIAFKSPRSSTGFRIPAAMLIQSGFSLQHLSSPKEKPDPDKIGYVFATEELNATLWVHMGLVQAAAVSNLDWVDEGSVPTDLRRNMEIFHESPRIPRSLVLLQSSLDEDLKNALEDIFFHMHQDPKAKKALKRNRRTSKYEYVDKRTMKNIEDLRQLLTNLNELEK